MDTYLSRDWWLWVWALTILGDLVAVGTFFLAFRSDPEVAAVWFVCLAAMVLTGLVTLVGAIGGIAFTVDHVARGRYLHGLEALAFTAVPPLVHVPLLVYVLPYVAFLTFLVAGTYSG